MVSASLLECRLPWGAAPPARAAVDAPRRTPPGRAERALTFTLADMDGTITVPVIDFALMR